MEVIIKLQYIAIITHWTLVFGPIVFIKILMLAALAYFAYIVLATKRPMASLPKMFQDEKGAKKAHYDVAIVGAGPAGSTLAYYLAKSGRKVLLLEKKKFPRDKYCGDAVCKTAVEILMDMGIYEDLINQKKAHVADSGGLVSPGGLSYIGESLEIMGDVPAAIACKRLHLDNAIAMAAKKAGADLKENSSVSAATLDKSTGLWTLFLEGGVQQTYQARVLACCDGAPSALATKLGIVRTPPQGSCSRAYVEPGTHKFKADGVVIYNKDMLPGYSALFRHPNDELNYCVYIIPGNPQVGNDDLPYWHDNIMKNDPYVSRALGDKAKVERMKVASLRFGGVPRSYGNQVILVGDSAGMIDPMTGEGIHLAMDGGRLAAGFLEEVLTHGNVSREAMEMYHERWMDKFGNDFAWSSRISYLQYKFPILIDAATAAIQRKGDAFMAKWADIMTGRVPKVNLLLPDFVIVVGYELAAIQFRRLHGFASERLRGFASRLKSEEEEEENAKQKEE
ncbi:conditioned medium factor receptor 1 [Strongylocentrotus purpuratus]|uniref:FAD-binding domain-containing protein n=1 Tax=Strongylocentrotus purpuratus TaxID=7668 RepID=A0A7M7HJZ2_STRPU|nr:conditioned medium factor receptor 1 [Strongylocentrotus purpuratus]